MTGLTCGSIFQQVSLMIELFGENQEQAVLVMAAIRREPRHPSARIRSSPEISGCGHKREIIHRPGSHAIGDQTS
jgi:hypothetical protein